MAGFDKVALIQVAPLLTFGQLQTQDNMGWPSSYNAVLFSGWTTVFGGTLLFDLFDTNNAAHYFQIEFDTPRISIWADLSGFQIGHATLEPSGLTYDAFVHLLVAVHTPSHTIQVFVNDVQQFLTTEVVWFRSDAMVSTASTVFNAQAFNGFADQQVCLGDLWFTEQAALTDLTVTANRRKFINADLTPVDLGSNGQTPFGAPPRLFLHTPVGGVADDYLTNRGTGGGTLAYSSGVSFGFGTCTLPPPPNAPTGLNCGAAGSSSITAQWTAVATADVYSVHYRAVGAVDWLVYPDVSFPETTIGGLAPSTSYEWQVLAKNLGGLSAYSGTQICVTTAVVVPPPPAFKLVEVSASNTVFTDPDGGSFAAPLERIVVSAWFCLHDGNVAVGSAGFNLAITDASTVTVTTMLDATTPGYTGIWTFPPVRTPTYLSLMFSLDSSGGQPDHLAINDAIITPVSTGWASVPGPFYNDALAWSIASPDVTPNGVGDVFIAQYGFDLTNVSLRRIFINADLTPTPLINSIPGDITPTHVLSVPDGIDPAQFLYNYTPNNSWYSTVALAFDAACTRFGSGGSHYPATAWHPAFSAIFYPQPGKRR